MTRLTTLIFKINYNFPSDQYSDFRVGEVGVNLNGLNTQGENIADNGGIKQAFRAYTAWKEENGPESPLPNLQVGYF